MFCFLFSFFFRFLLNVSGLIQIHSNTSKKKTCLILNVCKCQMVYVCMYVCMYVSLSVGTLMRYYDQNTKAIDPMQSIIRTSNFEVRVI